MMDKNLFENSMEIFSALNDSDYDEGFVAFIDMLGTSALLQRTTNLKNLAQLFSSLQLIKDNAESKKKLTLTRFSDSIYVVAPKDSFCDLLEFLACCNIDLLQQSWIQIDKEGKNIEHMEGQLLRGGVCYGKVFSLKKYLIQKKIPFNDFDDFMVGPTVPKAYELESKYAKNPRIIFDEDTIKKAITSERWKNFVEEGIFVKDDDHKIYLDYIEFLRKRRNPDEFPKETAEKCIEWAEEQVDLYKEDEKVYPKYKWLMKYLEKKGFE